MAICQRGQRFEQVKEYLDELAFLSQTAGAKPVRSFVQNLDRPNPKTYVGAGKLEEIKQAIEEGRYPVDSRRLAESFAALERMV